MKIDCHTFLDPGILEVEDLLRKMDREGIDKCVLIPKITNTPLFKKSALLMSAQRLILWKGYGSFVIRMMDRSFHGSKGVWNPWYRKLWFKAQTFEIVQVPDNEATLQVVRRHPDRFMAWVFVNPTDSSYLTELTKFIREPNMIGVWVHPFWHRFGLSQLNVLAKILEEYDLPITITLGHRDSVSDLQRFCLTHPKVKTVFAHAAFPLYRKAWPTIKASPNKFIDLSTHHVDRSIVTKAIGYLGYEKCIFGSGDPYGDSDSGSRLSKWIGESGLNYEEQNAIFSKNLEGIIETQPGVSSIDSK